MRLDRRAFMGGALLTLGGSCLADENKGLFWRATAPGKAPCVLFGYARFAASVTQDIVADGIRYIEASQRVVLDMPNFHVPASPVPGGPLPPVLKRVSESTAKRLRAFLEAHVPAGPARETIPGLHMALLLHGEGQTNPQPTVGGAITDHAGGKPASTLLTLEEVQAAYHAPDWSALDARVDDAMLTYLLGLRDIVGPLGKFEEGLYARRRIVDLQSASADMARHNVPGSRDLIPLGKLEPTLTDRVAQAVKSASDSALMMLPVELLTQDRGILARLRADDIKVELLG